MAFDLFSDEAIAAERARQAEERRERQARRKTEWAWIQQHEPEMAKLLADMKAAGVPAQGIEWVSGGPWADAA